MAGRTAARSMVPNVMVTPRLLLRTPAAEGPVARGPWVAAVEVTRGLAAAADAVGTRARLTCDFVIPALPGCRAKRSANETGPERDEPVANEVGAAEGAPGRWAELLVAADVEGMACCADAAAAAARLS